MRPFPSRRARALQALGDQADALLVTSAANVRYLTGFTGSNGQLLLHRDPLLLTDGRYGEQAAAEAPDLERVVYRAGGMEEALGRAAGARGVRRLGIEALHLTVAARDRLAGALGGVELVPTAGLVERLRLRKEPGELEAIVRAQRVAEAALVRTLGSWRGGTERDLALALEWAVRTGGAEGVAFEVIVASGPHAALPHARPRDVPVAGDSVLLVDLGAVVDGYCSDMTRTFLAEGAPPQLRRAHRAVVRALEAAVAAVRPGAAAAEVDRAARGVLEAEGLGEAFVHSTGHGVGLEVHEPLRLAPDAEGVLEEGMVLTVEPGVYFPGVGGVRVEDLVVVRGTGAEVLTRLPRGPELPGAPAGTVEPLPS